MGKTLSVIACAMPALPKGELLSSCRVSLFIIGKDRCFPSLLIKLPPRGSWQSRQALTERVQAAQQKDAFTDGVPSGENVFLIYGAIARYGPAL